MNNDNHSRCKEIRWRILLLLQAVILLLLLCGFGSAAAPSTTVVTRASTVDVTATTTRRSSGSVRILVIRGGSSNMPEEEEEEGNLVIEESGDDANDNFPVMDTSITTLVEQQQQDSEEQSSQEEEEEEEGEEGEEEYYESDSEWDVVETKKRMKFSMRKRLISLRKAVRSLWKRLLKVLKNLKRTTCQIPYKHLTCLPFSRDAQEILTRLKREFDPIIQRRGYNVVLVGEFNDEHDVCEKAMGTSYNMEKSGETFEVQGYNAIPKTVTNVNYCGRQAPLIVGKRHVIGIRLRERTNNMFEFREYSQICETMCHELAHCEIVPHNEEFFKLMDEIQREHAQVTKRMSNAEKQAKRQQRHQSRANQKRTPFRKRTSGRRLSTWRPPRSFL